MKRLVRIGILAGLIITFLSWIATLVAVTYPGSWVDNMGSVVYAISILGWLWLGWRVGTVQERALTGGLLGGVSGLVVGVLAGVPQTLFLNAAGAHVSSGGKVAVAAGSVLSSVLAAAVFGVVGSLFGKLTRKTGGKEMQEAKGDGS